MFESDWPTCAEPHAMLGCLCCQWKKPSDRKVRLFAVACCRRFSHLTQEQRVHKALDTAERFADGLAQDDERSAVRRAVRGVAVRRPKVPKLERRVASLVYYANARSAMDAASEILQMTAEVVALWHNSSSRAGEQTIQCGLLREIFGNPFCQQTVDPSWLNWRTGVIPKLAQTAYDERDFDMLPILGDALQDAGCTSVAMLDHCRIPGAHVRGCWVVDLLLGKS